MTAIEKATGKNREPYIIQADERPERQQVVTYQYKGGIVDFVKHLNATKEPLYSKVCHFEDEDDDGQMLDIAIQWNTGYHEGIHGYANGISTTEGGMHVEGFKTALTSVINKFARAKNLLKEKDPNLTGDDVREGLISIRSKQQKVFVVRPAVVVLNEGVCGADLKKLLDLVVVHHRVISHQQIEIGHWQPRCDRSARGGPVHEAGFQVLTPRKVSQ